jgi:hypothetical protein
MQLYNIFIYQLKIFLGKSLHMRTQYVILCTFILYYMFYHYTYKYERLIPKNMKE